MPQNVNFPPEHLEGGEIPLVPIRPEDGVVFTQTPGQLGQIRVSFSAAPNITWWKGLEVKIRDGDVVAVLETHDASRGPVSIVLNTSERDVSNLHIRLLKAMMFGVHTAVYDLPNLGPKVGKNLSFRWIRD
ncbi:MAG TPA: hypothetical protein VJ306_16875 [Pyrinomonadaceae bacterium]|jgi:hypothetical protein|nr:hypothetical protein [Pyrinomonadaceae bacterium]